MVAQSKRRALAGMQPPGVDVLGGVCPHEKSNEQNEGKGAARVKRKAAGRKCLPDDTLK